VSGTELELGTFIRNQKTFFAQKAKKFRACVRTHRARLGARLARHARDTCTLRVPRRRLDRAMRMVLARDTLREKK
jgi:hypothetical protein